MDREDEIREAVTGADDTGLIANQELIAGLHAALPEEHEAHATIDRLHAEMNRGKPDVAALREHVRTLRSLPELEATIANWWDDPRTQRVIAGLGQIGL